MASSSSRPTVTARCAGTAQRDGEELLALFIHCAWENYPDERISPRRSAGSPGRPRGTTTPPTRRPKNLIGWHVNRGDDEAADFHPAHVFAAAFRNADKVRAALDGV